MCTSTFFFPPQVVGWVNPPDIESDFMSPHQYFLVEHALYCMCHSSLFWLWLSPLFNIRPKHDYNKVVHFVFQCNIKIYSIVFLFFFFLKKHKDVFESGPSNTSLWLPSLCAATESWRRPLGWALISTHFSMVLAEKREVCGFSQGTFVSQNGHVASVGCDENTSPEVTSRSCGPLPLWWDIKGNRCYFCDHGAQVLWHGNSFCECWIVFLIVCFGAR